MSLIKGIFKCMFSPKLNKIYGQGSIETTYQEYALEKWSNKFIHSLYIIWRVGVYTSPLLVGYLYQRDYFTRDGLVFLTNLFTQIGVVLIVSCCCRGYGRYQNPIYNTFLNTLDSAENQMTPEIKRELSRYDFDFSYWPVEYSMQNKDYQPKTSKTTSTTDSLVGYTLNIPFKIISYIVIHTFGIKLIYPGSLGFLQLVLEQPLAQGRSRLIELFKGERNKVVTIEGNEIDTMYVNRRSSLNANGNTLVVCCEGNAGFYEIGIMMTPLEAGYSVLGWNHPGFAGSTGQPYPSQEQNAIDAVLHFAVDKLGFKIENILLFGWSIGGYSSSWIAMNYPDIKGIIIDATFDDILPLARNYMPLCLSPIVNVAIREYFNLDIFEQLCQYSGPISLIRRTDDEVVCLIPNDLSSNRGNNLLIKLLKSRYPLLFDEEQERLLKEYLSVTTPGQNQLLQKYGVNDGICHSLIQTYVSEYSKCYPMKIGEQFGVEEKNQMVLFLAQKYMKDFNATHCVNLPVELFQLPWDINVDNDYVFT